MSEVSESDMYVYPCKHKHKQAPPAFRESDHTATLDYAARW